MWRMATGLDNAGLKHIWAVLDVLTFLPYETSKKYAEDEFIYANKNRPFWRVLQLQFDAIKVCDSIIDKTKNTLV